MADLQIAAVMGALVFLAAMISVEVGISVALIEIVLGVIGVCFLLYIGWVTWRSEAHEDDATKLAHDWPVRRQIVFALSVSLLNPHAILDTIGVVGDTGSLRGPQLYFEVREHKKSLDPEQWLQKRR